MDMEYLRSLFRLVEETEDKLERIDWIVCIYHYMATHIELISRIRVQTVNVMIKKYKELETYHDIQCPKLSAQIRLKMRTAKPYISRILDHVLTTYPTIDPQLLPPDLYRRGTPTLICTHP